MIPQITEFDIFLKLKELEAEGFTGILKIYHKLEERELGSLFIQAGFIKSSEYQNKSGEVGLMQIFIDQMRLTPMIFHQEPMIETFKNHEMSLSISKLHSLIERQLENHLKWQTLRPPSHIKILLDREFLSKDKEMGYLEYQLAAVLVDYHLVEEIYHYSPLHEYETSLTLSVMRKKGFLKVMAEEQA